MVAEVAEAVHQVDILVNNAGILRIASFPEIGEADFDATVDLNAAAPTLARVAPEELKHFTPVLFEMFNRHLWQVWDRLSEAKPTGCVWKCDSRRTATTRTFRFTIDRVMNEKQRENLRPWKPGQSGNPSGRPKTAPIPLAFWYNAY